MIGFFRQKNPGNVFLLLIYALVLKFSIFLHPVLPVLYKEDNYLYRFILLTLNSLFNNTAILYSILTFLLLFAQALAVSAVNAILYI